MAPTFVAGMTPNEIRMVDALYRCRFTPGSPQKRFVRKMAARDRRKALTERQREYLWRVAWSWRRQLPPELVALAGVYTGCKGFPNTSGRMEPVAS